MLPYETVGEVGKTQGTNEQRNAKTPRQWPVYGTQRAKAGLTKQYVIVIIIIITIIMIIITIIIVILASTLITIIIIILIL